MHFSQQGTIGKTHFKGVFTEKNKISSKVVHKGKQEDICLKEENCMLTEGRGLRGHIQ